MESFWTQFYTQILDRSVGPMAFRILIQPAMAAFFAIRSGITDAKAGRPLYFWAMLTDAEERRSMMKDGWKDVGKVFIAAIVIDVIYELKVLHAIRPLQAIVVALILAILPYLLFRGLANRIARSIGIGPEPDAKPEHAEPTARK